MPDMEQDAQDAFREAWPIAVGIELWRMARDTIRGAHDEEDDDPDMGAWRRLRMAQWLLELLQQL